MTGQLYYPLADRNIQRYDDDYAGIRWEGDAEKGCIHTTETSTWPAYGGGKSAPTATCKGNFRTRTVEWRQHFPANMSVRALQNDAGGVETNRDKVIQVEIVGTCDPAYYGRWKSKYPDLMFVPEAPDWFLDGFAKFMAWCKQEHGIPLISTSLWLPYPRSYGNSPARMTGAQFNSFRGWLGHQHVAENDHGDPGDIHMGRLLTLAKLHDNPTPAPPSKEAEMQTTDSLSVGPGNAITLNQPDGATNVGEAIVGTWAAAVRTERAVIDLTAAIREQNALLTVIAQNTGKR